jgi:hypothetical protein
LMFDVQRPALCLIGVKENLAEGLAVVRSGRPRRRTVKEQPAPCCRLNSTDGAWLIYPLA